MKKIIAIILASLMIAGLAGCMDVTGNENDNPISAVQGYRFEMS